GVLGGPPGCAPAPAPGPGGRRGTAGRRAHRRPPRPALGTASVVPGPAGQRGSVGDVVAPGPDTGPRDPAAGAPCGAGRRAGPAGGRRGDRLVATALPGGPELHAEDGQGGGGPVRPRRCLAGPYRRPRAVPGRQPALLVARPRRRAAG